VPEQNIYSIVADFCHKRLFNNKNSLDYLVEQRKLTIETINKFEIGLFPQNLGELFKVADPKELRDVGLIKHASRSMFKVWDLVMPVRDVYGNYVALAGRTMLSEQERDKKKIPKYMNSTYDKSCHLFGLNFAKHSILKTNVAYVVEGHFDAITPHQHGLTNFVAVCGAYFSTRHLALLSRYTERIVLLFDNEPEAQNRAQRIVEKKGRNGVSLLAKNPLPKDIKDIDQFLKSHSAKEIMKILEPDEEYNIKPFWD
jgi:DNA primase